MSVWFMLVYLVLIMYTMATLLPTSPILDNFYCLSSLKMSKFLISQALEMFLFRAYFGMQMIFGSEFLDAKLGHDHIYIQSKDLKSTWVCSLKSKFTHFTHGITLTWVNCGHAWNAVFLPIYSECSFPLPHHGHVLQKRKLGLTAFRFA